MDRSVTVELISALDALWRAIRRHHPDTPDVILLPAPSIHGRRAVLGHFAPLRWQTRKDDTTLIHEVVVVAEYLDRSPTDVLETLLHEAAHAVNFQRGIRDCSASQYHNRKFKAAAEELGLCVTQVKHYGFALTELGDGAAERYADQVDQLTQVLAHRRLMRVNTPTGKGTASTSRHLRAQCSCGFIIRVSRKTASSTIIVCMVCGEPFRLA